MIHLLAFVLSGAVVVYAGAALARHADAIAESTRIGRLWIGSVLLAGATSLPELTTDIAAVRMGAPDLAVGDLFGSSLANMLILALVTWLTPRGRMLRHAAPGLMLVASLAIGLNALAAMMVLVGLDHSILWVGPGSVVLFCAYLAGTRASYLQALAGDSAPGPSGATAGILPPLRPALLGFGAAALIVLLAAPLFAWSAKGIAEVSGLGNTFVGTWLVGLATSLPELVASLAAVRMGAPDLAVTNLFGSNAFNMAIFLPLDLAQPGNLFSVLDSGHALSGLFAAALTGLGLSAIVNRPEGHHSRFEPGGALMLLAYVAALLTLYCYTAAGG